MTRHRTPTPFTFDTGEAVIGGTRAALEPETLQVNRLRLLEVGRQGWRARVLPIWSGRDDRLVQSLLTMLGLTCVFCQPDIPMCHDRPVRDWHARPLLPWPSGGYQATYRGHHPAPAVCPNKAKAGCPVDWQTCHCRRTALTL